MVGIRWAAAALLVPGGALAQDALECAALASIIEWELIDGGEGDLDALVAAGDGAACRTRLDATGFGAGLYDPDCAAAFSMFWTHGAPPGEGDPAALLFDLLTGAAPATCTALLGAYG